MSVSGLFNNVVLVKRITLTRDEIGGRVESEEVIYPNMPCRLEALRGIERPVYGAEKVEASWRMIYPKDYDLTTDDVVVYEGKEFDVLFVRNPEEAGHHNEADLREREL